MSVVVAEGVVEVTADGTAIPRKIARDIDANGNAVAASGTGMGKRIFGGVIAGWAAIGGVNAVVGFFKGAVGGASDLNETMSKSSTIFGENAKTIEIWGSQAYRQVGLSKEAAMDAAAGFGNMFTQLGFAGEAAVGMSLKTVQMAADLGSFNNVPTAEVSDRISAALRGEYDSLQALIPNINAARVEKEAMTASGKDSAASLTAQEKATAVLAIVQRDGSAAMGDFAKTADGAANKSKIVTAQFADQQSKLGQQLLPAWQDFLGFLNTTAIPVFTSMVDWIGENSDTVLMLAGVIGGTALAYGIATTAGTIYKAYQVAAAASTGGLTVAQWALNAAMSANPIGLVVLAIGALVAGIVWVATQTNWFQETWANVTSFIGAAATWLWETVLSPVFTAIGGIFTWLYGNIIKPVVTGIMIYVGLWAAIFTWLWSTVISPIFGFIGAIFSWLYKNAIVPVVNSIVASVKVWGAIFSWLYNNIISPVFAGIGTAFKWVWSNVISPVINLISGAISRVGNTVKSVFGGIAGFVGTAFKAVMGVIRGPINGIIGLINRAIGAVNSIKVTIPSWVPIVGGQSWGLSLPKIPMLARGSRNAPDTFIAGENGPELITGAAGSRVYSNSETRDMLTGMGKGDTYNFGGVSIPADSVDDFVKLIEMFKKMTQAARQGRRSNGTVTP